MNINERIKANTGLVYSMINKYFKFYKKDEEVIQAGLIGLWKACINFNPNLSRTFASYACQNILNNIKKEIKIKNKPMKFSNFGIREIFYEHTPYQELELKETFCHLGENENNILTDVILNNHKAPSVDNEKTAFISKVYNKALNKIRKQYS